MNYRRLVVMASMTAFLTLGTSAAFAADSPGAAEIYKTKCAACHGPDGGGQTPASKAMKVRDLRAAHVQKLSDSDLVKVISDGKGKMPPYKAKLSVADISSLVAYIRGLAK